METYTKISHVVAVFVLSQYGIIPHAQSGFYCKDPKLDFPYRGDTISPVILLGVSIIVPFLGLWLAESSCVVVEEYEVPKSRKQRSIIALKRAFVWYKGYIIGFGTVLLLVDIAKLLIGEPRPHFFDTCKPNIPSNCTQKDFITDFKCTNSQVKYRVIADASKSFPSGHAACSLYATVFLMALVQQRCPVKMSHILVTFLHVLCLLWALICCFSRITDNRHHWWDVLAGSIVGILSAFYVINFLCKNFHSEYLSSGSLQPVKSSSIRENGHAHPNNLYSQRQHSVRRLLSSTSSYTGSITPEERELREAQLS